MAWKFESGIPLTQQIADRIRREIILGVYERGADFPTVRQLAAQASVNPNTMQKALTLLEEEGLLVCHGTAGRAVTDSDEAISDARRLSVNSFLGKFICEASLYGIERDELADLVRRYEDDGKQ